MRPFEAGVSESSKRWELAVAAERARAEKLRASVAELTAVLSEVADMLDGLDLDTTRAKKYLWPGALPEDPKVFDLCQRHGFGAVIDSACRQWIVRDQGGAFVKGPCAGTARALRAKVLRAIGACERCGCQVDSSTCHCGSAIDDHHPGDHAAVPMGCRCHEARP